MIEKIFGGDTFIASARALDAAALRQQVIAHNLANANTPRFKRQDVQFEAQLSQALDRKQTGGESSVSSVAPRVITVGATSTRPDGNNVNMELESVKLAENAIRFEVMSQSVGSYFSGLKMVINGGR